MFNNVRMFYTSKSKKVILSEWKPVTGDYSSLHFKNGEHSFYGYINGLINLDTKYCWFFREPLPGQMNFSISEVAKKLVLNNIYMPKDGEIVG